jgi:hypothetical protein
MRQETTQRWFRIIVWGQGECICVFWEGSGSDCACGWVCSLHRQYHRFNTCICVHIKGIHLVPLHLFRRVHFSFLRIFIVLHAYHITMKIYLYSILILSRKWRLNQMILLFRKD